MDYNILWFVLLGVLLAGYAVLDGFDLGVGILYPFIAKNEAERRAVLQSIGPIWDGNEVWLVTFGGAMFAAFPEAYATIFSGFYLAFMVVLFSLIFRAISIEFRHTIDSPWLHGFCNVMFFLSSTLATFVFGVAIGASMQGIPLNARGVFTGSVIHQISLYAIVIGVMTVAMFMMHGAIYLYLKTQGALRMRAYQWVWTGFGFFLVMYLFATIMTLVQIPRATENFQNYPWAWGLVLLAVLAVASIPRAMFRNQGGQAFLGSCATIVALVGLFGMALFPNLVTSNPNPEHSLTVRNASSSQLTLKIMALIVVIGMPFVLTYTALVYWTFRGKVGDQQGY